MSDASGSPVGDTRDLDTRLLRTFVVVAREKSFTKAAQELNMTQQGVSNHIRRLEALLGCTVFDRGQPTGITLTDRGGPLLEYARAVVVATDNLFGYTKPTIPSIRVAEIRERHMMQIVWRAYRKQYPEHQVIFYDMLSPEQLDAVRAGRLDVGMGRIPHEISGISSAPLRLDPVMALNVTSTGPIGLRTGRLGYTGVAGDRYVHWVGFCEELAAAFDLHLEPIPHDNTMLEAIGHGQMLGQIPPILAMEGMRDYAATQYFHFERFTDIHPYYPWRIFWRKGETRREVRDFISTALQVARTQRWLQPLDGDCEVWVPADGEDHLAIARTLT